MADLEARQKYLRRVYRRLSKPGANPVAVAAAARLQATIEEAHRRLGETTDAKLGATLLKAALEAEARLQRVLYTLGVLVDTSARRRSRAEEREAEQREQYDALMKRLQDEDGRDDDE